MVGLAQWEAWYAGQAASTRASQKKSVGSSSAGTAPNKKKKLSYKDQQDLDTIEARILSAETRVSTLEAESARPEVVTDANRLMELAAEISVGRAEVDRLYARWAELEALG